MTSKDVNAQAVQTRLAGTIQVFTHCIHQVAVEKDCKACEKAIPKGRRTGG